MASSVERKCQCDHRPVKTLYSQWHKHHGGVRHTSFLSPTSTTKLQHHSVDKSALMGAAGPSTIDQTREESCPPLHWAIGWQTLYLAMDALVMNEPTPAPLSHSPEPLENTALDNHSCIRQPLWKSRFPEETFRGILGAKKHKCGHIEVGKRNNLTLPMSPLPWGGTAQGQERPSWLWFLSPEK